MFYIFVSYLYFTYLSTDRRLYDANRARTMFMFHQYSIHLVQQSRNLSARTFAFTRQKNPECVVQSRPNEHHNDMIVRVVTLKVSLDVQHTYSTAHTVSNVRERWLWRPPRIIERARGSEHTQECRVRYGVDYEIFV